jgi:hypothetical protein
MWLSRSAAPDSDEISLPAVEAPGRADLLVERSSGEYLEGAPKPPHRGEISSPASPRWPVAVPLSSERLNAKRRHGGSHGRDGRAATRGDSPPGPTPGNLPRAWWPFEVMAYPN